MSHCLYLIRHGKALHNELFEIIGVNAFRAPEVIDSPLTNVGHQQAQALAETIRDKNIELVLVSPLMRALQTAHGIFKDTDIPIRSLECLREYPIGEDTCNQRSDISLLKVRFPKIDFSKIEIDEDISWTETRETRDSLQKRVDEAKKYIKTLPETKIAIVSHNGFIGQFKDNHIRYTENGEQDLKHCEPYEYRL
jgi:broad specificity phosphatase PhoE